MRLQEASQAMSFARNVDDITAWTTEVDSLLASEDFGKVSESEEKKPLPCVVFCQGNKTDWKVLQSPKHIYSYTF